MSVLGSFVRLGAGGCCKQLPGRAGQGKMLTSAEGSPHARLHRAPCTESENTEALRSCNRPKVAQLIGGRGGT